MWFRRRFRLPSPNPAIRDEAPTLGFVRYFEATIERPTVSAEPLAALARFESAPNRGTTVRVHLPAERVIDQAA
jgi:hypothetical protein